MSWSIHPPKKKSEIEHPYTCTCGLMLNEETGRKHLSWNPEHQLLQKISCLACFNAWNMATKQKGDHIVLPSEIFYREAGED